jgi:predicted O-linked N-acetylglucosamine transferase (SPINDLY family)
VLWLVSNDELTIANLQNEAVKRGVAGDRIIFAEPLPHTEHLLRYQLADLFIDTFWYGGHTTGLDAMWQGLPVLCCVGEVPTSRVGASYQYVLEMPEMVAENFEEYQAKAIYYGTNPEALKEVKQKLKEKITTTPLFDTPLTVKHIEKAYQMMWQRYQDGLPPETFDVPDLRVTH